MQRNILYIDPEPNDDIIKLLNNEGFQIEQKSDVCLRSESKDIDLILLSDKLQNIVSVLLERDYHYSWVPIMTVMKDYDEIKAVLYLEAGTDDFIAEPIRARVFIARIKSLIRRKKHFPLSISAKGQKLDKEIKIDNIKIYPDEYRVKKDNKLIDLTVLEFKLLLFFVQNRGKAFTRKEIMKAFNHNSAAENERIVDVLVGHLRKKLSLEQNTVRIRTIKGIGYVLDG